MFNIIRNDEDRAIALQQLEETEEAIDRQKSFRGQEKVGGVILEKLTKLRDYILNEIKRYDE